VLGPRTRRPEAALPVPLWNTRLRDSLFPSVKPEKEGRRHICAARCSFLLAVDLTS
jgi:hypothetical protein